ncbi:hypothetical protein [Fundidesulfovibrio putealis]|uniref:hypothetical protein n=1 Tax=Fundidesulfovibrio putealis TaxID=270496 RepID=UPI0012EC4983|nr:hypothetical protein [Fundidesulfovibrio putealis]
MKYVLRVFSLAAMVSLSLVLSLAASGTALAAQKAAPKAATTPDQNAQSLQEFFKGETAPSPKSLDFVVDGGYADIQTETPESSGRYFMAAQNIAAVAQDIYRLDLTFKKKLQRDVIDLAPEYFFTQQRSYYFWYNGGNRIVFKLGNARKEFKIQKKELTEIKVKSLETYSIEKTKLQMDLAFVDGGTKVSLLLKFR